MKNFTMRFLFDKKNETGFRDKKKVKGKEYKETGLLQIEVRQDGTDKRVLVSTGIRIRPDQFSDKMGFTCRNDDNAKAITGKARERYNEVFAWCESDQCHNLSEVKLWNADDAQTTSFIKFIEKESLKENFGMSSLSNFNSFMRRLKDFKKIQFFADITYANIEDFDLYIKKFGESQPVVYRKHKYLERYIKKAINRGLWNKNPYLDFEVKKGQHKAPVYLTEDDLEKLIEYEPKISKERYDRVKDLFLFQCFTGLAYTDLKSFSREIVIENKEGFKEIHSYRQKTKQKYAFVLLPLAEQIAEKYDYKLPVISPQKYNEYIKTLMERADINKNVTSHVARHTYATYLINNDVSIKSVSRALGHSSVRMTERYAQLLDKTAINEMASKLMPKTDKNEEPKDDEKK